MMVARTRRNAGAPKGQRQETKNFYEAVRREFGSMEAEKLNGAKKYRTAYIINFLANKHKRDYGTIANIVYRKE